MSKEEKLYTQGDIEELNKTIIDNNCEIILKDQRIAELEKQVAIRDKALELACEWIDNSSWSITDGSVEDWERAKQTTKNFYLEQAEEELKKADGENGKTD